MGGREPQGMLWVGGSLRECCGGEGGLLEMWIVLCVCVYACMCALCVFVIVLGCVSNGCVCIVYFPLCVRVCVCVCVYACMCASMWRVFDNVSGCVCAFFVFVFVHVCTCVRMCMCMSCVTCQVVCVHRVCVCVCV